MLNIKTETITERDGRIKRTQVEQQICIYRYVGYTESGRERTEREREDTKH